jgi:hypothetical protein
MSESSSGAELPEREFLPGEPSVAPTTGEVRQRVHHPLSRWPEYLAEMLVVMASIIGAFALDRWNDRRKGDREQVTVLTVALNELRQDSMDIAFNMSVHQDAVRSMDILLGQMRSNAPWHDSLALHFHAALAMPRFVHSTSAFETMKSRGMDLVSNEALRTQMIRLYGAEYANYRVAEAELADDINHGLRTIMPGRFREGFAFNDIGRSYRGTMVPWDFNALKRDRAFEYYLATLRNRTNVFVQFHYDALRASVARVRGLVDQEVRRRR